MEKINHRHLEDFLRLMISIIEYGYYISPNELEKEIDEYSDSMCAWCCFPSVEYLIWTGKVKIIERIEKISQDNGWVDINEKLPEKEWNYIWYDIDDRGTTFEVTFEDWEFHRADNENLAFITHWQPFPLPPNN